MLLIPLHSTRGASTYQKNQNPPSMPSRVTFDVTFLLLISYILNPLKYLAVLSDFCCYFELGSETADKTCTRREKLFIPFGKPELGIDQ